MIAISFGRWNYAAGIFLTWERLRLKGLWTPFCRIRKRYASWLGFWGK